MRAAAEMKKQMAPPGGNSGRGMMGIVLPMYAVGIVIYLLYTLTKVPADLSVICFLVLCTKGPSHPTDLLLLPWRH